MIFKFCLFQGNCGQFTAAACGGLGVSGGVIISLLLGGRSDGVREIDLPLRLIHTHSDKRRISVVSLNSAYKS